MMMLCEGSKNQPDGERYWKIAGEEEELRGTKRISFVV